MLEISYHFYHHNNESFPKEKVIKAILNRDFKTFYDIYLTWSNIGEKQKRLQQMWLVVNIRTQQLITEWNLLVQHLDMKRIQVVMIVVQLYPV